MLKDFAPKVKEWFKENENEIIWIGAVLIAAMVGFGAGRIVNFNSNKTPLELKLSKEKLQANALTGNDLIDRSAPGLVESGNTNTPQKTSTRAPEPSHPLNSTAKTYVASKNGSVYYLPTCGGVKLIKEANKIWFVSKEEAQRAGYKPAANCKEL